MGLAGLLMLLPVAVAPLLLVLAGLAWMIGARNSANSLLAIVAIMVCAPVVLADMLAVIPTWILLLSLPVLGFMVAGAIVSALFGRRVWQEALGHRVAPYVGSLWVLGTVVVLLFALI